MPMRRGGHSGQVAPAEIVEQGVPAQVEDVGPGHGVGGLGV